MADKLIEVKDLKTHFDTKDGLVKAVDGINFSIARNEIMALVGESGCGKSVTSLSIMGLVGEKKSELVQGEIVFKGEDLMQKNEEELRQIRGNEISIIFQDPMTSLNPVYTVGNQLAEVPTLHETIDKESAWKLAVKTLDKVGISSAESRAEQYPHQFSGGMRQRGVIGMSLMCGPDLLIADEPTTALDVTIQAQILDLIKELRDDTNAGIMMITHNMGVVAELCDTVAVMYAGQLVEKAPVEELFENPLHPYTHGLLASVPQPGQQEKLTPIDGQPPDLNDLPPGCRFAERCPDAVETCQVKNPTMVKKTADHAVACWREEDSDE